MARGILRFGLVPALAVALGIAAAIPADAGHRNHHGDAIVAGVAGVLLGTMLAAPRPVYGAPVYSGPVYVEPAPVYVQPAPVYVQPAPVYVQPAPVYVEPAPIYVEPAPVHVRPEPRHRHRDRDNWSRRPLSHYGDGPSRDRDDGPRVVTYDETVGSVARAGRAEPWSPEWFDYCRGRFRSFDSKSGTYLGYDGKRHFCVMR